MSHERHGQFTVFSAGDRWYFHLQAANGEIIAQSEGYNSRQAALDGIESVRKNAALEPEAPEPAEEIP